MYVDRRCGTGGYTIRPYGVDGGQCGWRSALHTEGCGRAMRAPTAGGIIEPGRKSEPGPGGHKGRPYERTGSVFVGADCISARTAPPRRTHPAERTP